MKEITVRYISNSACKTFLSNTSPLISIAGINNKDGGLDIKLMYEIPSKVEEECRDIKYPMKWKESDSLIIDYPLKYTAVCPLLMCYTLYDLIAQIQNLFYDIFANEREEVMNGIEYKDLVLNKITFCKTGDVVVYVNKNT